MPLSTGAEAARLPPLTAMRSRAGRLSRPWPFITRQTLRHADGVLRVLHSRAYRKGLPIPVPARVASVAWWRCLWLPREVNWWIGMLFALGSVLFALGSVLSLDAALARAWAMSACAVNALFFAGSIPFTAGGGVAAASRRR